MITAQLGPPVAVRDGGRNGESSAPNGDGSTDTTGPFAALLAVTDAPSGNGETLATDIHAAGPQMGELLTETDADAVGITSPVVANLAYLTVVSSAGAAGPEDATTVGRSADGAAHVTTAAGDVPGVRSATASAANVDATIDAESNALPGAARAEAASRSSTANAAGGSNGTLTELTPPQPPAPAPLAAGRPTDGLTADDGHPEPAVLVTLRVGRSPERDQSAARSTNAAAAVDALADEAARPPAPLGATNTLNAPTNSPSSMLSLASNVPLMGATNAAELAHELAARMRASLREGGRELVVQLRPAELGHLTVRVTMVDGVLTAHVAAERPEAGRLLQQTLPQLDGALRALGFSVDSLDMSYAGQGEQREHDPSNAAHHGTPTDRQLSVDGDPQYEERGLTTPPRASATPAQPAGNLNLLI